MRFICRLLCLLGLIFPIAILGQNRFYFDKNNVQTKDTSLAEFYEITYRDSIDAQKQIKKTFYLNDSLKSVATYKIYKFTDSNEVKYEEVVLNGKTLYYNEQGLITSETNYKDGKMDGDYFIYYPNGHIKMDLFYANGNFHGDNYTYWSNDVMKRHEVYNNGKILKGETWDSLGKFKPYEKFIVMPSFPGGQNNLNIYLANNIRYPSRAIDNGVSGMVLVSFIVESNGSITNARSQKVLGSSLMRRHYV